MSSCLPIESYDSQFHWRDLDPLHEVGHHSDSFSPQTWGNQTGSHVREHLHQLLDPDLRNLYRAVNKEILALGRRRRRIKLIISLTQLQEQVRERRNFKSMKPICHTDFDNHPRHKCDCLHNNSVNSKLPHETLKHKPVDLLTRWM